MEQQLFRAVVTVGPRGRAVIVVPFDPGRTWGTKADHPVGGTIGGKQVRGRLMPSEDGWVLTITPMWLRDSTPAPCSGGASTCAGACAPPSPGTIRSLLPG